MFISKFRMKTSFWQPCQRPRFAQGIGPDLLAWENRRHWLVQNVLPLCWYSESSLISPDVSIGTLRQLELAVLWQNMNLNYVFTQYHSDRVKTILHVQPYEVRCHRQLPLKLTSTISIYKYMPSNVYAKLKIQYDHIWSALN